MKKRMIAAILCAGFVFGTMTSPMTVSADSATVVTVGADLTQAQKNKMYEYFGVKETEVAVIEVTNEDEREYLEGVATEQQIGHRTYSCAFIEHTAKGNGIHVKIANLNWVTSYMIATTLGTAGIYDCNVVAAAPFVVSGTGALTGIMKAFEIVSGEKLDEEKKELATEELIMTGDLAEEIGTDEATGLITEIKDTIIGENIVIADQIEQVIIDSSTKYEINLTEEQVQRISSTMEKIAEQEYDYERLSGTLSQITASVAEKLGITLEEETKGFFQKVKDFFKGIWSLFKGLFAGKQDAVKEDEVPETDLGILENTNDAILGEDAIIDATDDSLIQTTLPEEGATQENESNPSDANETDSEDNDETAQPERVDDENSESSQQESENVESDSSSQQETENSGDADSEQQENENNGTAGTEQLEIENNGTTDSEQLELGIMETMTLLLEYTRQ